MVTLEIRDRGRGIPDEKLMAINEGASGVGIRGMRDRVRHFSGEMKVQSNELGTTVSITLPTNDINSSCPVEVADDLSTMVQAS
jgi:signal transduction histidine kinase